MKETRIEMFLKVLEIDGLTDSEIAAGLGNGDIEKPEWIAIAESTDHIKVINTEYESDLYFNVVLKDGTYKGYRANYVGGGRMVFIHSKAPQITVNSKAADWMKKCWIDFIIQANLIEEQICGN